MLVWELKGGNYYYYIKQTLNWWNIEIKREIIKFRGKIKDGNTSIKWIKKIEIVAVTGKWCPKIKND